MDINIEKFISKTAEQFNKVCKNTKNKQEVVERLCRELGFSEIIGASAERVSARERMRKHLAKMSSDDRARQRAKNAEQMRERRQHMSPEQTAEERLKAAERMRKKRAAQRTP